MITAAPSIGAIPTDYHGAQFRSRLEARWAVFFDRMGIAWEFEPEGYTDGTTRYLPDFWLPEHGVFWEIKPARGSQDQAALRKIVEKMYMLADVTKHEVVLSYGTPKQCFDIHRGWPWANAAAFGFFGDGYYIVEVGFVACPDCGLWALAWQGYGESAGHGPDGCPTCGKCLGLDNYNDQESVNRVHAAKDAAEGYQFWRPPSRSGRNGR